MSVKFLAVGVYLSTVLYVQLRGQVRHKLKRLAADHANVLAPYNTLMYLFSAVPAKPYADMSQFPELRQITAQWQVIRDEALSCDPHRIVGTRIKAWNRPAYYLFKWLLIGALLYIIFV